jgi:hypothetical protein
MKVMGQDARMKKVVSVHGTPESGKMESAEKHMQDCQIYAGLVDGQNQRLRIRHQHVAKAPQRQVPVSPFDSDVTEGLKIPEHFRHNFEMHQYALKRGLSSELLMSTFCN